MRKVILYIADSIDNYIAKSSGDTSWLHDPEYAIENEDFGYGELIKSVDTTLMGHNTYKVVSGFDGPFPYADKTNYVFTRSARANDEHAAFIDNDIPEFVNSLKNVEGNDIWLIGGGQINTLLLDHNLIDEMIITQVPIILGSGLTLFTSTEHIHSFLLEDSKSYKNGFVKSTYKRK